MEEIIFQTMEIPYRDQQWRSTIPNKDIFTF